MENYEILNRLEKSRYRSFDLLLKQFKCNADIACEWCYLNTQLYDSDILKELSLYAIQIEDYESVPLIKKELEHRENIGLIFTERYKNSILLRIQVIKDEKNRRALIRFINVRKKLFKRYYKK